MESHSSTIFFLQAEYSQPFLKPPHLDQPISTLLLSDSAMAFGRSLVCDNDGNYKGQLMLSLKEGYALETFIFQLLKKKKSEITL